MGSATFNSEKKNVSLMEDITDVIENKFYLRHVFKIEHLDYWTNENSRAFLCISKFYDNQLTFNSLPLES